MSNKPTHVATMIISSTDEDPNVQVRVKWEPDLEGMDIRELGYLPAAYTFVQEFVLPALEEAYMVSEHADLMGPVGSDRIN